ncbi:MAG: glycine cleavage system protein GcvH [Gammaproteobacteria bacterium]
MKFGKVDIPEDLSYTPSHFWVRVEDNLCTVGWTDYIQRNAGDVNYIELTANGTTLTVKQDFGTIETSKWVERLYSPVGGRVLEVNDRVIQIPWLINRAPFGEGWFIKIEMQGEMGPPSLMSTREYREHIKTCDEDQYGITGNGQIEHRGGDDPGI